jgi:hypothetical protein
MAMTFMADWRNQCWAGTKMCLSEDTGLSRNTMPKAITGLDDREAIVIVRPFGQNLEAVVFLPLYERFAKLSLGQRQSRENARFDVGAALRRAQLDRDRYALELQAIREPIAYQSPETARIPCPETHQSGNWLQGRTEDGSEGDVGNPWDYPCGCGQPIYNHPISDHEPQLAFDAADHGNDDTPTSRDDDYGEFEPQWTNEDELAFRDVGTRQPRSGW